MKKGKVMRPHKKLRRGAKLNTKGKKNTITLYQIRSVAQSCLTLCDPMNSSMPGLPVHHQLPEFTETRQQKRH